MSIHSLFYLTSIILFGICIRNIPRRQLFTEKSLLDTLALISPLWFQQILVPVAYFDIRHDNSFCVHGTEMYLVLFQSTNALFIDPEKELQHSRRLVKAAGFVAL